MSRFHNSIKIAIACVISVSILLFLFRESIPLPQSALGGYGNVVDPPTHEESKPSKPVFDHDVFSDLKDFPSGDSTPQQDTTKPIVEPVTEDAPSEKPDSGWKEKKEGRNDYWSVEHGRILPGDSIESLNGLYSMNLSIAGELKIWRHYADQPSKPIFWTNTDFQWVGSKYATVDSNGLFQTYHQIEDENDGLGPKELGEQFKEEIKKLELGRVERSLQKRGYDSFQGPFRTWSSIQWPQCQKRPEEGMTAIVVLTDTGALQIKHLRRVDLEKLAKLDTVMTEESIVEHMCEIFEGENEAVTGDMGTLAVVLAGTMRSWKRCCKHLNEKVLDQWPGSGGIDVFVATGDADVYGYDETEDLPWLQIQDELNRCLNGRLRLLEHVPLETETFPDLESTGGKCNGGMTSQHRLINQVKTVYRGGQLLMQYAIRTGTVYDYVLKMRPDHLVWGDSIPTFEPLPVDVLRYPMPYWEPPTWSMRHTRISHSVPSDQMAFGRLLPMMTYFNLYPSYVNLVRTSQEPGSQDYPPCFQPDVPCPDWEGHSPCFIEGLSGYWPTLNGIKYMLDWRWKVSLLREEEGQMSKDWRMPWNRTQGTRYVENAFQ